MSKKKNPFRGKSGGSSGGNSGGGNGGNTGARNGGGQRGGRSSARGAGRAATSAGVIGHIATLLDTVLRFDTPADSEVSAYFRSNPFLGKSERGEVAEAVFAVLRRKLEFAHLAESGAGSQLRRLALLGLAATQSPARVAGMLGEEEAGWLDRLRGIDRASLSPALRDNLPDWFSAALDARLGPQRREALAQAMLQGAPLDLRVNLVKSSRESVLQILQTAGVAAAPTPYSPVGIRLEGKPALNRFELFNEGAIEVQDEGSQLLCCLVAPRRGEMVVDFCAGAGGKTVALGAMMRNSGRLYALDVSEKRLARLKPRLSRSALSNVHPVLIDSELDSKLKRMAGKADRVLVDAPCSGLGTLRRNPDLKWRQSPAKVAEMTVKQASILAAAAKLVKPGGRLVYATCSLLPEENQQIVDAFLAANPQFARLDAGALLREARIPLEMGQDLELLPDTHLTDGFYAAVMQREAAAGAPQGEDAAVEAEKD
ncbi:MAG: RsmB/NOP family class I SAM-dependent RNA methyltransferase [Candidatus Protistobacter heckmanni]|nr:RsmB/NOP family class I SAM-dependent RNA methyltransferase [Candidatus Protistobacter heckmanni]